MKPLYVLWARAGIGKQGAISGCDRALQTGALQYAPAFVNGRFSWARALQAMGRFPEALSQLQVITTFFSPHDSSVYVQMALIYREMGDRPEEIRAYEKALNIDPHNLYSWLNLGLACRQAGELEARPGPGQALSRLDEMIYTGKPHQYDPEEDKVSFEAARTEFARGAFEQASLCFYEYSTSRSKPGVMGRSAAQPDRILYNVILGTYLFAPGKVDPGAQQLEPCLAFAPNDPPLLACCPVMPAPRATILCHRHGFGKKCDVCHTNLCTTELTLLVRFAKMKSR